MRALMYHRQLFCGILKACIEDNIRYFLIKKVYKQFREICDTVKRKDVELLNKTKQIKLLTAEWKEKEQQLGMQMENLKNENRMLWAENGELRVELERSRSTGDDFVRKMKNAELELGNLYQKLAGVDGMFYECRQKGLYQ